MKDFEEIARLVEVEVEYHLKDKVVKKTFGPFREHRDAIEFMTRDEHDRRGVPNRDKIWAMRCRWVKNPAYDPKARARRLAKEREERAREVQRTKERRAHDLKLARVQAGASK